MHVFNLACVGLRGRQSIGSQWGGEEGPAEVIAKDLVIPPQQSDKLHARFTNNNCVNTMCNVEVKKVEASICTEQLFDLKDTQRMYQQLKGGEMCQKTVQNTFRLNHMLDAKCINITLLFPFQVEMLHKYSLSKHAKKFFVDVKDTFHCRLFQ